MPRRSRGIGQARDGVRVPGVYQGLLRRERERAQRSRTVLSDPKNPGAGVFRRPTRLLRALEAGEAVTVAASQLGSREVRLPAHMRPGNAPGSWWRVSPDDVVERTVSPVVDRPRAVAAVVPCEDDGGGL